MDIRMNDLNTQKLEFYLNFYFTSYPILDPLTFDLEKYKTRMPVFKNYLEKNGKLIAEISELQEFCMLPYISNPIENEFFSETLTKGWKIELRKTLNEFLSKILPKSKIPIIYSKLSGNSLSPRKKINEVSKNIKVKPDISKEILSLSKDLLSGITATLNGEKLDKTFIDNCSEQLLKYEAILGTDRKVAGTCRTPGNLDYKQIKVFLKESQDGTKIAKLLKVLRLRVNSLTVREYFNNDILDCKSTCDLLRHILNSKIIDIAEEGLKFVKKLLRVKEGEIYFTKEKEALKIVFEVFTSSVSFI